MKKYDIVLYGATGFTGKQAARYLAQAADAGEISFAIAGRRREALSLLRDGLPTRDVGIIVADSNKPDEVEAMVSQAKVIANCAGPFAKYGTPVVQACVEKRVDYVDITGETPWVRSLIDSFHDQAEASGTRIIPFCGFDSVPSDLGAWLVVRHFRDQLNQGTRFVKGYFRMGGGGFNGGTFASFINMAEQGHGRAMANRILLNPDPQSPAWADEPPDQQAVIYDAQVGGWTAPFMMASINTRVVRRSAALAASCYQNPYGDSFKYEETLNFGSGLRRRAKATAYTAGLAGVALSLRSTAGQGLLKRLGPSPGEGPSEEAMDGGFVRCDLHGQGERGDKLHYRIEAQGDAGNRFTVATLCESALALVLNRDALPGGPERGGLLTPALGLGDVLVERLRKLDGFVLQQLED
jgi:short subunit dehydrogenase-like uncharacterized protein